MECQIWLLHPLHIYHISPACFQWGFGFILPSFISLAIAFIYLFVILFFYCCGLVVYWKWHEEDAHLTWNCGPGSHIFWLIRSCRSKHLEWPTLDGCLYDIMKTLGVNLVWLPNFFFQPSFIVFTSLCNSRTGNFRILHKNSHLSWEFLSKNFATLLLSEAVGISVNVPVTEEDNRIHNNETPSNDSFAHLEVQFRFFNLNFG